MLIPGGDQIRSRMTLNVSKVRKLVQTAHIPKPQINPAVRSSFSGIENMGQAPHVFPQPQDKFAAQQFVPALHN
jgi:hypothetical protein